MLKQRRRVVYCVAVGVRSGERAVRGFGAAHDKLHHSFVARHGLRFCGGSRQFGVDRADLLHCERDERRVRSDALEGRLGGASSAAEDRRHASKPRGEALVTDANRTGGIVDRYVVKQH